MRKGSGTRPEAIGHERVADLLELRQDLVDLRRRGEAERRGLGGGVGADRRLRRAGALNDRGGVEKADLVGAGAAVNGAVVLTRTEIFDCHGEFLLEKRASRSPPSVGSIEVE